jgi:hypothetical protein
MIQHLLRCQGLGVNDYSRPPELIERDALHLQHPRLLQRQGLSIDKVHEQKSNDPQCDENEQEQKVGTHSLLFSFRSASYTLQ